MKEPVGLVGPHAGDRIRLASTLGQSPKGYGEAPVLFRFDANQEYQLQAIAAVVDLFESQMRGKKGLRFEPGAAELAAKLYAGIMK